MCKRYSIKFGDRVVPDKYTFIKAYSFLGGIVLDPSLKVVLKVPASFDRKELEGWIESTLICRFRPADRHINIIAI